MTLIIIDAGILNTSDNLNQSEETSDVEATSEKGKCCS